jgi:hypothetical protein
VPVARGGIAVDYPPELRVGPADRELLKQAAQAAGGRFDPAAAELSSAAGKPVYSFTGLWPYLVLAAAILLVADVAVRRAPFALGVRAA